MSCFNYLLGEVEPWGFHCCEPAAKETRKYKVRLGIPYNRFMEAKL